MNCFSHLSGSHRFKEQTDLENINKVSRNLGSLLGMEKYKLQVLWIQVHFLSLCGKMTAMIIGENVKEAEQDAETFVSGWELRKSRGSPQERRQGQPRRDCSLRAWVELWMAMESCWCHSCDVRRLAFIILSIGIKGLRCCSESSAQCQVIHSHTEDKRGWQERMKRIEFSFSSPPPGLLNPVLT